MPAGTVVSSGALVSPGGQQGPSGPATIGLPIGTVMLWVAGGSPPGGWLTCDGSAVSRTLYPDLFALVGTTYGAGDGSTTFGLPDLRGRVPVGVGQGTGLTNRVLAAKGGEEAHQLTIAELASHTHIQDTHNHLAGWYFYFTAAGGTIHAAGADSSAGGSQAATSQTIATNQNTGGDGAHNTMPPFVVLSYIIKASATGGATNQAPIADTTQAGLVNKVSGLAGDYVGGDNACHRFAFPQDQPWAYGPFDDHFDGASVDPKWVQTLTSGMAGVTYSQAGSQLSLSGWNPAANGTDYENSVSQNLPAAATHTITVAFRGVAFPNMSATTQGKVFFNLAYGANAGGLQLWFMFYVVSGTGANSNDLRVKAGTGFGTSDSDWSFSTLPPYLQVVYDASKNTTVNFSLDGKTFMQFVQLPGSETGFSTNAPAQWRMGVLSNWFSRSFLQVDWIKRTA